MRIVLTTTLVLFLAMSAGPAASAQSPRAIRGPDTSHFSRAYTRAATLPRLRSLLVWHKGRLAGEAYFHGATRTSRANIKSASKSIISTLVGIAIAQNRIRGVHQTLGELLPAETRNLEARKRAITVGDLLSMRAGLQSTSFENYGTWVSSRNWVRDALRRPFVAEPGTAMIYSTGNTHLLSAILTRATGVSTFRNAERTFARPLGIALRPWKTDPQGIYFGGNDMFLTPREMVSIGRLYLNRGSFGGKQVVPRAWVDSSLVERTVSAWNGNRYGYGWWTRSAAGRTYHFAWGYGGQFIFIVPSLDLVVVTTSDAETAREGGHTQAIYSILEDEIIPTATRLVSPATDRGSS